MPGNDNGTLITEPLVNQAVAGVLYDPPDVNGVGAVTTNLLTATITITGGDPNENRRIGWGDGAFDDVTLSGTGGLVKAHTYAAPGTYGLTAYDTAGNVIAIEDVTVIGVEVALERLEAPNQANVHGSPAPDEDEDATPFDPSGHTVAEVLAYVEAHPEERDAILADEEAGKARVTLLDALAEEALAP